MIPLLGGLAGLCAVLVAPLPAIHQFWWAPLLIDVGTGYALVAFLFFRRR